MNPVIAWELRQRKAYILWWTLSIVVIVALLMLIYPSIRQQADQLNKALSQLPAALRDLKSGGSQVDIASPVGFLHSQLFYITLPIMQIIMAIGLGGSLLARDEQNHTLELLLSKPISRSKLLLAKALSGVLIVAITGVAATVTVIVLNSSVGTNVGIRHLVMANIYCTVFCISFGVVAYALTALSSRTRRAAIALAVSVSFGGYLLASLSGLSHYIRTPAKFLPYHYYNPEQILQGHSSQGLIIYLAAIFIVGGTVSWYGFRNRDIT